MPRCYTRDELVERLVRAGELEVSGEDPDEVGTYFDVITVPGYPRRVEGRQAVAELYRPYGATFSLDRCYDLAVHHDQFTGVVVLEYASQGRAIPTGTAYRNRYISVLSIVDRKIAHWRDYLDPLAVFDAIGWPVTETGSS
jgi:ketosteroid isomerase-like protein